MNNIKDEIWMVTGENTVSSYVEFSRKTAEARCIVVGSDYPNLGPWHITKYVKAEEPKV